MSEWIEQNIDPLMEQIEKMTANIRYDTHLV